MLTYSESPKPAQPMAKVWLLEGKYEYHNFVTPLGIYSAGHDASIAARIFMMEIACNRDIYHPLTAELPSPIWKQRKKIYQVTHVYGGIKFKFLIKEFRIDANHSYPVDFLYEAKERAKDAC